MANAAAYTGLRRGELATLTIGQVDVAARVIAVDRKVAAASRTPVALAVGCDGRLPVQPKLALWSAR